MSVNPQSPATASAVTSAPAADPSSAAPVPAEFAPYVDAQQPDRAALLAEVIALVESALPPGYERAIEFGMPSWVVPLEVYPDTYNAHPLAVAALAAQKNYTSLYLNCVYLNDENARSFQTAWQSTGKKLDMGKSCLRFRSYSDLAAEVIADVIRATPPGALIAEYEKARAALPRTKRGS
jgi:hypothetical protein